MSVIVKGGGGKPEEEKTVTAGTSVIEVIPSSGKTMKKVTVNPTPSQSKTVTPSTSQQTVSPDSGKLLSQVIVEAMEDVTPEVTAQTPIIAEMAEEFGVEITTPSGSNKQILQGNNSNLQSIRTNAKKSGAYVWKKLTTQGGDFVDFVISDQATAYPDGGTHTDGYWYERFDSAVEGIYFGYVTLTSAQSSVTVAHSLGKTPRGAMITLIEGVANDSTQRTQGRSFFGNIFTNLYRNSSIFSGLYSIYNSMSEVPSNGYPFTMGTEEITFTCYVNLKFKAGKYLWVAIA